MQSCVVHPNLHQIAKLTLSDQVDFTTLLLPPLSARLKHHTPQLLSLPPILAHTIYQTLDFDTLLRSRGYSPRGHKGEWAGLSEVILGEKEWFTRWLEGERECASCSVLFSPFC